MSLLSFLSHCAILILFVGTLIDGAYAISCGYPGDAEYGQLEEPINFTFGSRVYYKCNKGYNMISKYNYRDCQADGIWSNAVPECEVQKCAPPTAINDGSYGPEREEYVYLDAVKYECTRDLTLVGDASMSCTAAGNWSSEAPQCKVVECPNPVVANAKKLSGFIGPYKLNYNVRFECDVGFVMNGSYSVTCNVNGHWDPQLPSCRSSTVPTKVPGKEGQGNNVAVIVGVIVSILVIAAIAVLVWYFVEKRGKHNPDTHSAHYTTCNE